MLTRRNFIKAALFGGAGVLASGTALASSSLTTEAIEVVERRIHLPTLSTAFDGYRIAFLTDPHLGPWVRSEFIAAAFTQVSSFKPDLIILGGDYIWVPDRDDTKLWSPTNLRFANLKAEASCEAVYDEWSPLLKMLQAPDGILAVYGNHDRWAHPSHCNECLTAHDIRLLCNESHTLVRGTGVLTLIGADDYWTGAPDLTHFTHLPAPNEARLLITHNPDHAASLIASKRFHFDLALCGHTHGGQLNLPIVGPLSYNIANPQFGAGLQVVGSQKVYTSRGLGVVELPFRVNCPPEVSFLTLHR
jgi:uncharacterized protein